MIDETVPSSKALIASMSDQCVCFETDESVDVFGENATITVVFDNATTNPAGEFFAIFGKTFQTDNATAFTYDTFRASVAGQASAENFANMLRKNVFSLDRDIDVVDAGGGTYHVVITAKQSGEDLDYVMIQTGLSNPYPIVNLNIGVAVEFVPGYEIQWRLMAYDSNGDAQVLSPIQFIKPGYDYRTNAIVNPPCLNLSSLTNELTRSPLLDLSLTNMFFSEGQYMYFYVNFWGAYLNGSTVELLELNTSTPWHTVNASVKIGEDFSEFYWKAAPYRFLTNMHSDCLCRTGMVHLYIYVNNTNPIVPVSPGNTLFWARNINGSRSYEPYETGVLVVPVNMATVGTYAVKVEVVELNGLGVVQNAIDISETLVFNVGGCGECTERMFFLNSKGGYDPIDMFKVDLESVVDSGYVICKEVSCGSEDRGYKQLVEEGYEEITLSTRPMKLSEENLEWFKEFKVSETKLILWKIDGTEYLRRFLVNYGTFNIWKSDGVLKVTITGRFSNSIDIVTE